MRKKFKWAWLAWLALLLWLGEYSQRQGAKPMIGEAIWISPTVKETFFNVLYFFSTISALCIALGFIIYVIYQVVSFLKQRMRRKPSNSLELNDLVKSIDTSIQDLLALRDSLNSYKTTTPQNEQANESNKHDDI